MRLRLLLPALVALQLATLGRARADNDELARYLAKSSNYRKVRKDVLAWHGTLRNGCVAFVSTALRDLGIEVPLHGTIDGSGVSRITRSFSIYLATELGWQRIEDAAALRPGDVVFTADDPCCQGYPAHVFVFHGWKSRTHAIARVIDNQGFDHERPLAGAGDLQPFAYALREPDR